VKIIRDELGFCDDCMVIAINGYSDTASDEQTAASIAGIERLGVHLVPAWEEWGKGHEEFTWHPCACCGTKLGGARYDFAVLGPE
jgi:hypothetical protein